MDQEEFKISCGEGRYLINVLALVTADGISITLTGGEKPHVGAMAMSVPGSSAENNKMSCDTWIIPRAGHKDDQAAAQVARQVCLATGQPVAVTAGIHIDQAEDWEIEQLLDHCRQAASLVGIKINDMMENNHA